MESKWNLFIGDLSSSVVDSDLWDAFSNYSSLVSARVMIDAHSRKSKGYGFVSFSLEEEALKALNEMNGKKIKDREVRVNWAVQRVSQKSRANYDKIFHATPYYSSTVYIGNIPDIDSLYDTLSALLLTFGYVLDLKICDGFAFAKFDSHHSAALSILQLNGTFLQGSMLRVSWGKDKFNSLEYWPNTMMPMMMPYPVYTNPYFAYPNLIQPMESLQNEEKNNHS